MEVDGILIVFKVNIQILATIYHFLQVLIVNYLKNYQIVKKGLINVQNKDNKCFLWCHVRYLNCKGLN